MKNIDNDNTESIRRPIIPFDQVIFKEQTRPRNKTLLQIFMTSVVSSRKKYELNKKQRLALLQKINDKSFQQISFKKNLMDIFHNHVDSRLKLFKPDDTFMLLWNFLNMVVILFNFAQIPLSLFLTDNVYQSQLNVTALFTINIISLMVLFFDMLFVRFNLSFFRHGKMITSRSQIFVQYVKLYFWFDLGAYLSYFIYFVSKKPYLIYLKLLFYLKVVSLRKIDQQIQYSISTHLIRFCLYKIYRVIMFLWLVTTWASSIYFSIDYYYYKQGGYYYQSGQLWLTNSNCVQNINLVQVYPFWYVWYEYAAYWSLQTSAGIGYGNMTPRNPPQVLYCNVVILMNTIFFSIFLNTIWQIIDEIQNNYSTFIDNWMSLKDFLKNNKIPRYLNKKVANYLQQIWVDSNQQFDQQQFNCLLSQQLQLELYIQIRKIFFQPILLFQQLKNFSLEWNEFLKEFIFVLQKQKFGSEQIMFDHGEKTNTLYLLTKGKIGLSIDQLQLGYEIHVNQHLGAVQFVTNEMKLYSAVSLTFCEYWKVSSEKFRLHQKNHPNLYFKYCQLKQRIILDKQVQLCNSKCFGCHKTDHYFKECPVINLWRKDYPKPGFIKKNLKNLQQNHRRKFLRNDQRQGKIKYCVLQSKEINCHQVFNFKGYRNQYNIY